MVELSNAEEAWVVAENELRATKKELADFKQKVSDAAIRSTQLHEKTKKELQGVKQELADFRQEVSDAVSKAIRFCKDGRPASAAGAIGAFVIPAPKPDPLVDAMNDIGIGVYENIKTEYADTLRADLVRRFRSALDARGLEIREKNDD